MARRTRTGLKLEIERLEDDVTRLEDDLEDSRADLAEHLAADAVHQMSVVVFEAEGRKMEGREFGEWILSSVKRFVSYG